MSNLLIICLVYFVFTTLNIITRVFDMWSTEKQLVAQGRQPFSNFMYYYEIIPYGVSSIALAVIAYFNFALPNPNTIFHIIVFTLLVAFIYFLVGVITVFIISIIDSKKAKKDKEESQDN